MLKACHQNVAAQFYEYGVEDYPSPSQAVRYEREPLGLQPATEIISLSDYRSRHALYRMDRGLQVSLMGPAFAHALLVRVHKSLLS